MAEFKIGRLRVTWGGPWLSGVTYARDTVVQYNGKVYLCLAPHLSANFINDIANGSWGLQIDGKAWLGAYTAAANYVPGNLVTYGGTVYVCTTAVTIAPAIINLSNWATYTQTNKWNSNWSASTNYGVGDVVRYGGIVYTCNTTHTSATYTNPTYLGLEANQSSWTILFSGINYVGTWTANTRYRANDVVKEGPELFICTTYNTDATFTPSRWTLWMPGMELAGTWLVGTTYQQGDIVLYGGYSYISNISNNTGNNPFSDAVNWTIVTTGFTLSGEWNISTTYPVGAIVTRNGRSYSANSNSIAQDPDAGYITAVYNSTGSSGTTVVVNSVTGIGVGDFVIGAGFNYGQYVSAINIGANSVTLSDPPNATLTNSQAITFVGVNTTYWTLLIPGAMFKGAWNTSANYLIGDTVTYRNTTYYAVNSNFGNRPDLDVSNTYWITYIKHFQKNASGVTGDITYYSTTTAPQYSALAIGTTSYMLRVSTNQPAWAFINAVPNTYYVSASNGQDTISYGYGTTWDQPWATIAFACRTVGAGLAYTQASTALLANREYLVQEMYYWMLSQKASSFYPFTSASVFDKTATLRDARYVVDAIAYDIARGGNSQTVAATLAYFAYGSSNAFYNSATASTIVYTIAALNQLLFTIQQVIIAPGSLPTTYQTLNSVTTPVTYTAPTGYSYVAAASTSATTLMTILTTALTNQSTSQVPAPNSGLTATIFVKTGTYSEVLPITIPENVALVGDELRSVTVQPASIINTIITATNSSSNLLTAASTVNMTDGAPVQLVASVNAALVATTLGGLTGGNTYYIVGPSVTATQFGITSLVRTFTGVASTNVTVVNATATEAVWNVSKTTTSYNIAVNIGGSNYTVGDVVKILGTSVQGATTANDIIITVTSVTSGTINGFTFTGSSLAPSQNVTVANGLATGATFTVVRNGAGFTVTLGAGGTNYTNSDTIKILGTTIGGSTPLNDISISVVTTNNGAIVTFTYTGSPLLALTTSSGSNLIYGGGALKNMFYMRNGSGLRNMTTVGLLGTLSAVDAYQIRRPTGGAYVSLDPGTGPDDTSAWIFRKSPYVQNVSTFGTGCIGYKVDGTLHAGGNKSIVSNDFTQVLSDGIGIWCIGPGSLTEAVSVFSYYAYSGYLAEAGGRIRATNGNSSYGTFGVVATGYDTSETPITGNVFNQSTQVQATVQSTLTGSATLLKLSYTNAGSSYTQPTTNLLTYSNAFVTSPWANDGNITLSKNSLALTGITEAWVLTGTSASASSGYVYQNITVSPSATTSYTLSLYVYAGTASSVDISGIFSGTSTVTSNINYAFATNTVTPSSSGGGLLPVNYGSNKTLVTGWYRIWMSIYDTNGANTTLQWRLYAKGAASGNTGNYSIAYGAQTEISAANYTPSFYLESQNTRFTAYANFEITGAGTGVVVVGDELRSKSVFNARVTDPGAGPGGAGYLTASNFAQAGTTTTLTLALVDQNVATNYIGMRAVISGGTGTGQYGYISAYNSTTKIAQILQESFDVLSITSTTFGTNVLGLSVSTDYSKLYINQPIQFLPQYYTTTINNTNLATMSATASVGGTTNTLTVTSTASLAVGMQINFAGTTFSLITVGYTYYVSAIIDSTTIQITSTIGGAAIQLTTASGTLTVYYPAYSSYIGCSSTTNMSPGLPIQFTGTAAGGIAASTVYYINDVINSTTFTISVSQVSVTATSSNATGNLVNVGSTGALIPLNPIVFTGVVFGGVTAGQKYYISNIVDGSNIRLSSTITTLAVTATTTSTNYITTVSTSGFIAGNPIKFFGNAFGNLIVETTYYILQIISGTQFTITGTQGSGTAVTLNTGAGAMTARTCTSTFAITTVPSGSMSGLTSATKLSLYLSYNNLLTGTFNTQLFGGISSGVTYYVKTFNTGTNQMTVVTTSGGSTSPTLTTSTGAMALGAAGWDNIVSGTPSVALDTSSIYYIEPRTTFVDPAFTQTNSSSVQSAGAGNTWKAIGYGQNYFIALPNTGQAAAGSVDGSNWTSITMPVSAGWTSIAYGNGYWIAVVAGSGTAYVSNNNGVSWAAKTLSSTNNWTNITYGNGVFVIVCQGANTTAYSTNFGETWTGGTVSIGNGYYMAYGNGRFVTLSGLSSNASVSTDGITWANSSTFPNVNGSWIGIAFGNGRFVVVSSSTNVSLYSFNGTTWYVSRTEISAATITYGQGVFLAFYGFQAPSGVAYTSEDGLNWTAKTVSANAYSAVAFGYTNVNNGVFTTLIGQNGGNYISAGIRAKGRAIIVSGVMTSISLFEPGSGYTTSPTVSFTDPNVTTQAVVLSRIGNGTLGNPSFVNSGTGYATTSTSVLVTGNGYADQFQTGYNLIFNNISGLPSAGCDLVIVGDPNIYKVTSATAVYGTTAPNIQAVIGLNPFMTTLLSPVNNAAVTIRTKYSQVRLTNHDFLNIGYGNFITSNYPGIPSAGYTAVENNQAVEANFGRVFYTASDQDGNFKVGTLFGVQQSTGVITLSTSQFGLTGLSQLSLGGISVGGNSVSITQFSTDPTFLANSDAIIPTQKAVKSYLSSRLSAGSSNTVTTIAQAGNLVFGGSTISANVAGTSNRVNVPVRIQGALAGVDGNFASLQFFTRSFNHRSPTF